MQQIADWLEKLGMSEYAQRFAENGIDFGVLPDLTDQDLKDVGVILGHRRKLLRAIAELNVVEKGAPKAAPPAAAPVAPQDAAERRQVTVMFSDLVGSTALSGRMDPEDLREVISAYQKCVAETVQRFGGFVAKYMGDGVLVYFGYPQAHEDDPERAVRAGLELIQAVAGLKSSVPLRTRLGIATGVVVVGDLIGAGEAQERGIVGETPNLAARLQGVAEPNTVVLAESTRKLIGNLFELQDLGARDLKGIAEPAQAWAALRPSAVESRFEALHGAAPTSLVGREEELELLLRRWSKAKTGEGQVVLLSGEAGIGKSRLTAALLERLAGEPHTRLRYFCSPQHTDSAFYPIISQMERAAGFAHADTPKAKLDKLERVLAQTSTSAEDAALFAEMLSLPNDECRPKLDSTPEQRRQRTLSALVSQTEALARANPVLMIFEDAHWADPTSLEVLGRIVDRVHGLRVLLIVTFRSEFQAPWMGRHYVTPLTINRLGERDIGSMIDRVAGNKPLPANIRHDIIERTDGIPLFVEEMTKAVLEAESEGAAIRIAAAIPPSVLTVPASLQGSLMARLDRLGSAKEVAQIGAAIGREFSHAFLSAVARKPEAELARALDRLIATGLLFQQGIPPHASYLFKHALVQDAAYGTLLREPRRALHARIAETLENQFTEIAESQPELLARHCSEAGLIEKAAQFWAKAAERSLERSAFVEAVAQATRALTQVPALPSTLGLRRKQIELQVSLAVGQMSTKGMSAPETRASFEQARLFVERAEALGDPSDDPLLLYRVLNGLWNARYVGFDGDAMRQQAAHCLALAEKQHAVLPRVMGHRLTGTSLMWTGNIREGRAHLDRAIGLCDHADDALATHIGKDYWVAALADRSACLWILGYPEAATRDGKRALKDARAFGRAAPLMYVLNMTSIISVLCGDRAKASAQLDECIALATKQGAMAWRTFGAPLQGNVLALTGKPADAVQMISTGVSAMRSMGARVWIPFDLTHLAWAYAELNQLPDAWRCIDEALTEMKTTKEKWFEAEINRFGGEIALKLPKPEAAKAEVFFERALTVARDQDAKSWELRAAMSMARLWRDQGKRNEARDLLAPVYGWFTEGFDTRDLKEAKALLDELA
jgi:class 3 adenylate cyclase/predicted ATPase